MGAPLWYWVAVAAIFGLAVGSFSTVAVSRWPRGRSLVVPGSHCTACERPLCPYELVPVLSWLALRGRCRTCGVAVSIRYPAIELASGGLAALAIATFGPTWHGVAAALLLVVLVPVVLIDLEHRLIPDILVLPAAALGLSAAIAADPSRWWLPVAAAGGAAAFLGALWLAYPAGMGFGDVKLAPLLGAVLGASIIPAFAMAFLAGGLLGAALLVRFGQRARKIAVPFAPFLAGGGLVALWAGPTLIDLYGRSLG